MGVNLDKPSNWKADIAASVDMYNEWFLSFAPDAFRSKREQTTRDVAETLRMTGNHSRITADVLKNHPAILPTLRMSTCPPLAVDRLIGLAGVARGLVTSMEKHGRVPPRMGQPAAVEGLSKIAGIIRRMIDPDVFVWLDRTAAPTEIEINRSATIVADRLCGALANPIIRNAQEQRQLAAIKEWLEARGYAPVSDGEKFHEMEPGTYGFRMNVPVRHENNRKSVNIPVDAAVLPSSRRRGDLPVLIEAKSAGDFANTNKRRKEEAQKMTQLRSMYGDGVRFCLFLCGYFDSGYLGYEAAEGIDWVWEHRIDDLEQLGF